MHTRTHTYMVNAQYIQKMLSDLAIGARCLVWNTGMKWIMWAISQTHCIASAHSKHTIRN